MNFDLASLMGGGSTPVTNAGETILLSPLALLKMLKHGRAGVPMEVMGLMLGECVDDMTIAVFDVFAMPQSGTGQNVESIDENFQAEMVEKLARTGCHHPVVGWYHSHPGFGCWLSMVDQHTQEGMERMDARQVALVVDPIRSVRGRVVIDCFRCIPKMSMMGGKPFQTASGLRGFGEAPSPVALIRGLNKMFYNMPIAYTRTEEDDALLSRVRARTWAHDLGAAGRADGTTSRSGGPVSVAEHAAGAADRLNSLGSLVGQYRTKIRRETTEVVGAVRSLVGRPSAEVSPVSEEGMVRSEKPEEAAEAAESAETEIEDIGQGLIPASTAAAALAGEPTPAEKAASLRESALRAAKKVFAKRPEPGKRDPERHLYERSREIFGSATLHMQALSAQALFIRNASIEIDLEAAEAASAAE